jgi:3-dehydroquinate synthase
MQTVHIRASRPYDALIGAGLLPRCGELAKERMKPCAVALVTDTNVDALYGDTVAASLKRAGFSVLRYVFPAGEASKNILTLSGLLEFLGANHVTRTDCIAALEEAYADLAGFAPPCICAGSGIYRFPPRCLRRWILPSAAKPPSTSRRAKTSRARSTSRRS